MNGLLGTAIVSAVAVTWRLIPNAERFQQLLRLLYAPIEDDDTEGDE
jgi:hypothetical protein